MLAHMYSHIDIDLYRQHRYTDRHAYTHTNISWSYQDNRHTIGKPAHACYIVIVV